MNEIKTQNRDIFREFVSELANIAYDIFESEKPFGFVRLKNTEHAFGIVIWGEDIDNTNTSAIYIGDDYILRDLWYQVVDKMNTYFIKLKISKHRSIKKGLRDIKFLQAKTEEEAKEYVFHRANEDEGYCDVVEFTI